MPPRVSKNFDKKIRRAVDHLGRIRKSGSGIHVPIYYHNVLHLIERAKVSRQNSQLNQRASARCSIPFVNRPPRACGSANHLAGANGNYAGQIHNLADCPGRDIVPTGLRQCRKNDAKLFEARLDPRSHKRRRPPSKKNRDSLTYTFARQISACLLASVSYDVPCDPRGPASSPSRHSSSSQQVRNHSLSCIKTGSFPQTSK